MVCGRAWKNGSGTCTSQGFGCHPYILAVTLHSSSVTDVGRGKQKVCVECGDDLVSPTSLYIPTCSSHLFGSVHLFESSGLNI